MVYALHKYATTYSVTSLFSCRPYGPPLFGQETPSLWLDSSMASTVS
jgi:hypothetical protein